MTTLWPPYKDNKKTLIAGIKQIKLTVIKWTWNWWRCSLRCVFLYILLSIEAISVPKNTSKPMFNQFWYYNSEWNLQNELSRHLWLNVPTFLCKEQIKNMMMIMIIGGCAQGRTLNASLLNMYHDCNARPKRYPGILMCILAKAVLLICKTVCQL